MQMKFDALQLFLLEDGKMKTLKSLLMGKSVLQVLFDAALLAEQNLQHQMSGLWWCISLPNCCKNLVCRSLEMQGVTPQLYPRMSEDQISQKRLKALVQSLEWTYGVVWKLSSSDGWVSNSWPWELQRSFYSLWLSISLKSLRASWP